MVGERPRIRPLTYLVGITFTAALLFLTHSLLLSTPFYWDELGQFVPASLDLFQQGAWIPITTVPNIHPPGLMAYLALFWQVSGFSVIAARIAMLSLASLGAFWAFLLGTMLCLGKARRPAFLAWLFLCFSPLFVAQSMLVQLDMPAMAFTCLALLLFLQCHFRSSALACVFLVMVKETGIVLPAVFGLLLLWNRRWQAALLFTAPIFPLAVWLFALHRATGHWAGNESFAAYNAVYSLHPVRFILALARRLYYLFIGTGHWVGTLALIYAWRKTSVFRTKAWLIAGVFAGAHVLLVSLFGGAVLERYLMPVLPLLYIAFALAFIQLPTRWRLPAVAAQFAMLLAANFVNPIYPFPFENNLAFVDFCRLNRTAAHFVERNFPHATVTTTFPLAGGLRTPAFGYVQQPIEVREVPNFETPAIAALAESPPQVLILYSVAWDPLALLSRSAVRQFLNRFYGYQGQPSSREIGGLLHMHLSGRWTEGGQWIEVWNAGEPANPDHKF